MSEYVLVTCFGTILSVADHGALIHGAHETTAANITFDESGSIKSAPSNTSAEAVGIAVRLEAAGKFALKRGGSFVCAEPQGTIALRTKCDRWETFTRVLASTLPTMESPCPVPLRRLRRASAIPKIVQQTYEASALSHEIKAVHDSFKAMNPDWQFRAWTNKDCYDFIYEQYGWEYLKLYLSINPRYGGTRADFFRYLCMYKYGGVYLDIKSSASIPLSELIGPEDSYLLCRWDNQRKGHRFYQWGIWPELQQIEGGEFQQWHIIAAPGHPFLEAVIERVVKNIVGYDEFMFGVGHRAGVRVTGPIPYTLAIQPILSNHPHRMLDAIHSGLVYAPVDYEARTTPSYKTQTTPAVL